MKNLDYQPDDFEKAQKDCQAAADDYKDYVYQKMLFEARSKDMLASIKMSLRKCTELMDASDSHIETVARATDDWKRFREQEMDLLADAGRAEVAYNEAIRRWATMQSILAIRREEIRNFRG